MKKNFLLALVVLLVPSPVRTSEKCCSAEQDSAATVQRMSEPKSTPSIIAQDAPRGGGVKGGVAAERQLGHP